MTLNQIAQRIAHLALKRLQLQRDIEKLDMQMSKLRTELLFMQRNKPKDGARFPGYEPMKEL